MALLPAPAATRDAWTGRLTEPLRRVRSTGGRLGRHRADRCPGRRGAKSDLGGPAKPPIRRPLGTLLMDPGVRAAGRRLSATFPTVLGRAHRRYDVVASTRGVATAIRCVFETARRPPQDPLPDGLRRIRASPQHAKLPAAHRKLFDFVDTISAPRRTPSDPYSRAQAHSYSLLLPLMAIKSTPTAPAGVGRSCWQQQTTASRTSGFCHRSSPCTSPVHQFVPCHPPKVSSWGGHRRAARTPTERPGPRGELSPAPGRSSSPRRLPGHHLAPGTGPLFPLA